MNKYSLLILSFLIFCTDAYAGKNLRFVKNPFNHDYSKVKTLLYNNGERERKTEDYLGDIFDFGKIESINDPQTGDLLLIPVRYLISDVEVRYPVELYSDTKAIDCSGIEKTLHVHAPSKVSLGMIEQYTYQLLGNSCAQGNPGYPTAHYLHMETIQFHPYDNDIKGDCGFRRGIHEELEMNIHLYFKVHFIAADGSKQIRNISCKATERFENDEKENFANNRIILKSQNCVGIDGYFENLNLNEAFYFPSMNSENPHQAIPGFTEYTRSLETEYMNSRNN